MSRKNPLIGAEVFDVCEAYHLYASLWHEGQFSTGYSVFGVLDDAGFGCRDSLRAPKDLSEEGRTIYDSLVRRKSDPVRLKSQLEDYLEHHSKDTHT
jgi:hypothetical protein